MLLSSSDILIAHSGCRSPSDPLLSMSGGSEQSMYPSSSSSFSKSYGITYPDARRKFLNSQTASSHETSSPNVMVTISTTGGSNNSATSLSGIQGLYSNLIIVFSPWFSDHPMTERYITLPRIFKADVSFVLTEWFDNDILT